MTLFLYLLPIVVAIILFIFFRKKVVWWEYLILILPSALLTFLINLGMISYTTSDTEYYGNFVTEIRYYEPWNEYIHRTCYHTIRCGKTTTSIPYDCSYVDYHSEEYKQVLNNGYEYSISKDEYNRLKKLWKTETSFYDMKRDYHTQDGDMYYNKYDNNRLNAKTVSFSHDYKNKVKCSYSIFHFKDIDKKEAAKMGLYDYPKLVSNEDGAGFDSGTDDQNPFIGYKPTSTEMKRWKFINGYYGQSKQFRTYLLFYYNKPQSIVDDQKSYWQGGNKNEMIICFGLDSITKEIQWTDAFSWEDTPTFEVNYRSFMTDEKKLDLIRLADWTENAIQNGYWKRKDFKDFDYINIELSNTQLTWLFIIILIFNICMGIYIVLNDTSYENDENTYYKHDDWNGGFRW